MPGSASFGAGAVGLHVDAGIAVLARGVRDRRSAVVSGVLGGGRGYTVAGVLGGGAARRLPRGSRGLRRRLALPCAVPWPMSAIVR